MQILLIFTVWVVRLITVLLKLSGKGRGTALPGLLVEKYCPSLIPFILNKSPYTILITGTNGKTSTRTFLVHILEQKHKVISNKSGSNMLRGIISEILTQTNLLGSVNAKFAVFEVEEATISKISTLLRPEQIIVTNLFRDQLDAYGEIDRTQKFIQEAINKSPQAKVVLNGDDPKVVELDTSKCKALSYVHISDDLITKFKYEGSGMIHEDTTDLVASNLEILPDLSTKFIWSDNTTHLKLPGYFQIYNALLAISSAIELGFNSREINAGIESTIAPFGRGELVKYDNTRYRIFLIKNPAGFNLTLDLLTHVQNPSIAIILNDKIADGRDVSWIWDSEIELLNTIKPKYIFCSGSRVEDILLRVKHAYPDLVKQENNMYISKQNQTTVTVDITQEELLKRIANQKIYEVFILATYTSMLKLRKLLTGNSLNV